MVFQDGNQGALRQRQGASLDQFLSAGEHFILGASEPPGNVGRAIAEVPLEPVQNAEREAVVFLRFGLTFCVWETDDLFTGGAVHVDMFLVAFEYPVEEGRTPTDQLEDFGRAEAFGVPLEQLAQLIEMVFAARFHSSFQRVVVPSNFDHEAAGDQFVQFGSDAALANLHPGTQQPQEAHCRQTTLLLFEAAVYAVAFHVSKGAKRVVKLPDPGGD